MINANGTGTEGKGEETPTLQGDSPAPNVLGLDWVKEWLHYCGRCNSCKYIYRVYEASCPAFEKFKWESYTSSGKVWLARDLYEGKYPLDESIRDIIYACTLCGNCTVQCQQEIGNHALDIFEALRQECVKEDLLLPAHKKFADNIDNVHNPYGESHDKKWEGVDDKYFKDHAEVFFFVGCTTSLRNKPLFLDTLAVLDGLGVDFSLSREEWCCGSPLLTTGQTPKANSLAEHNSNVIKKLGASTVITACAGCFRTLKQQYPEKFGILGEDSGVRVLHVSEFLEEKLKDKKNRKILQDALKSDSEKGNLKNWSKKKITITYHDPCHLGRHMGVYEAPRNVLKLIPGLNFVEMPRNRENAWCCGAGAGVKSGFSEWSVEISEERIHEVEGMEDEVGTLDYLVSTCPFCERNLSDAKESLEKKGELKEKIGTMEVIDLVSLLRRYF